MVMVYINAIPKSNMKTPIVLISEALHSNEYTDDGTNSSVKASECDLFDFIEEQGEDKLLTIDH